jgi:hypothetical protein
MEPRPDAYPLLNLPRELRDLIFSYCVHYPDLSILMSNHLERARQSFRTHFGPEISEQGLEELLPWSSFEQPEPLPMQTLGIFLVNRQISAEALEILHSKTLTLNVPIPVNNSRNVRAVFVTDFIGERTLQSIRRCLIDMSFTTTTEASGWHRMTNHLTDIWADKNSLLSLVVNIDPKAAAPFGAPRQEANAALFRRHIMSNVSIPSYFSPPVLILCSLRICPRKCQSNLTVLHRQFMMR